MKKAAVFFAMGFEEVEALTQVDLLRRAGVDVDMVSITDEQVFLVPTILKWCVMYALKI